MIVLSKQQILLLHSQLISGTGGSDGLREVGLLESAINSPIQQFGNEDLYPTIQQKASRLCFGLVNNHPFIDGNKRIGAHVMLVILALNGIELEYTQDDLSSTILKLASNEISYQQLTKWIINHQI